MSVSLQQIPPVFLLTDFGHVDHYVAVMKAIVLKSCPGAPLVDICHHVTPQRVEEGCYLLESVWPWLPTGAIVLAVVDPGVGTDREAAVFAWEGKYLVGPNNGLFGFLPSDTPGRVLENTSLWNDPVSATFHGRDVFAPCAAWLAAGGNWTELGTQPTRRVKLETESGDAGRIIHFDRFGNAISNIRVDGGPDQMQATVEVPRILRVLLGRTYGDVPAGQVLAYVGSTGRVEIAVNGGNARESLGLHLDDKVTLRFEKEIP